MLNAFWHQQGRSQEGVIMHSKINYSNAHFLCAISHLTWVPKKKTQKNHEINRK